MNNACAWRVCGEAGCRFRCLDQEFQTLFAMGHRVKVYRLNEQGTWDDLGTGSVSLFLAEDFPDAHGKEGDHLRGAQPPSVKVVVHSEVDPQRQLLFHSIEEGVVYNRQGDDTIITWNDLYIKTDIALSFQEPSGCADVWNQIQRAVTGLVASGRGMMVSDVSQGMGQGVNERVGADGHHGYQYLNRLGMVGGVDMNQGGASIGGHQNVGHQSHVGGHALGDGLHELDELNGAHGTDLLGSFGGGPSHGEHGMDHVVQLPEMPSLQNLETIASIVAECTLFQREAVAQQLLQPGYLKAALDAFGMAEDIEDEEGIKAGHALVKGAIMLNDVNLLEAMFSDELVVLVVGALEYDPSVEIGAARGRYRDFVQGDMNLKEVVPITDPASRSKIIQAHRIMYVRDTILPKSLDDSTFSTLSSMYLFNIVEVLLVLHQDQKFFRKLFDRIHQTERGSADWRDLISFLQELITLSRHIQMSQRNDILMHLSQLGLFRVLSDSLRTDDTDAKLRAIDAILATTVHDPLLLRSHIQNQEDGTVIFEQLIAVLLQTSPSGLQEQALDVIKILLDPDTMDSAETKDVFCGMFYDNYITSLIDTLAAGTPSALRRVAAERAQEPDGAPPSAPPPPSVSSLLLIVDLLSYCISQHSYRIKYCILRSNAVETALELMERPEKALVGAALRLLKTCVVMKDEFYVRYVLQKNIMDRVLEAYLRFCRKENLIHSALLDLLDLLRRDNIRSLLSACVSSALWEQVEQVECDQAIMRALRLKHEMNTGVSAAGHMGVGLEGLNGLDGPIQSDAHLINASPTNIHTGRASVEGMVNVNVSDVDIGRYQSNDRATAAAQAMRAKGEFQADQDEEDYFSNLEDEDNVSNNAYGEKPHEPPPEGEQGGDVKTNKSVLGDHDGIPLPRLVDYESDDDDDTIPLSAGSKRKPPKIQLNLAGAKLQKVGDPGEEPGNGQYAGGIGRNQDESPKTDA